MLNRLIAEGGILNPVRGNVQEVRLEKAAEIHAATRAVPRKEESPRTTELSLTALNAIFSGNPGKFSRSDADPSRLNFLGGAKGHLTVQEGRDLVGRQIFHLHFTIVAQADAETVRAEIYRHKSISSHFAGGVQGNRISGHIPGSAREVAEAAAEIREIAERLGERAA